MSTRKRQRESGVMVRDEDSITEYFKPITPPSQKRTRLTERQKEVLASKRDKLPFMDDDSQQTGSNSNAVLKKRLPPDYMLDSQTESENMSQCALDGPPKSGGRTSPMKETNLRVSGPVDFSIIAKEASRENSKSPSRNPAKHQNSSQEQERRETSKSPSRNSAKSQTSSQERRETSKSPSRNPAKHQNSSKEQRPSSLHSMRTRSSPPVEETKPVKQRKIVSESEEESEEEEKSPSRRQQRKKSPRRIQVAQKSPRRVNEKSSKGNHGAGEKVSVDSVKDMLSEKIKEKDDAQKARKDAIRALLKSNREAKAQASPAEHKERPALERSADDTRTVPQVQAKSPSKCKKNDECVDVCDVIEEDASEQISADTPKEMTTNLEDLLGNGQRSTTPVEEKDTNVNPTSPEIVVIEPERKVAPNPDSQDLDDSVTILDPPSTPTKCSSNTSAAVPTTPSTPQSILRKVETPKSQKSDRRVTFSVQSEGRIRPRKPPAPDCIAPELVSCTEPITSMCMKLAPKKQGIRLDNVLKRKSIWTIGDFAGLSPSVIVQLNFIREPKVENVKSFLKSYKPASPLHVDSQTESKPEENGRQTPENPTKNRPLDETPVKKSPKVQRNFAEVDVMDVDDEPEVVVETVEVVVTPEPAPAPSPNSVIDFNCDSEQVHVIPSTPKAELSKSTHRFDTPRPSRATIAMATAEDEEDDFYDDTILEGFEMPKDAEKAVRSELKDVVLKLNTNLVNVSVALDSLDLVKKSDLDGIRSKLNELLENQKAAEKMSDKAEGKDEKKDLNNLNAVDLIHHLHSSYLSEGSGVSAADCARLCAAMHQFLADIHKNMMSRNNSQ